jgi:hypothetical protein
MGSVAEAWHRAFLMRFRKLSCGIIVLRAFRRLVARSGLGMAFSWKDVADAGRTSTAKSANFDCSNIGLEPATGSALTYQLNGVRVSQRNGCFASIADQEWSIFYVMILLAPHEGIDRFQVAHEPMPGQELQRAVDPHRRRNGFAVADAVKQLVGPEWPITLAHEHQGAPTNRRQLPAICPAALHRDRDLRLPAFSH